MPPLRPGDPVAIVAPSSAPRDLARYRRGVERLRAHYEVVEAYAPRRPRGYLAASDAERAAAINRCLQAGDVRALFCVRGGYGALRILPRLDYAAARAHPMLLVGYSDTTALHAAFYRHAGWRGLSGPVVTEWADAHPDQERQFTALAAGEAPQPLLGPGGEAPSPLQPGTGEGPLLGGNLSVLTRLVGTPFMPDLDGAVLVLEDVAEPPYRIDRMLAHLALAGALDGLAGCVLGRFSPPDTIDPPTLSYDEVVQDYFRGRPYPVATGLQYGHLVPRCTLPLGSRVRLSVPPPSASPASAARLDVLEPVA
jgi:muramoyltetrapeptide carboxypeptidase